MAASIKVSELQSLNDLTDVDLFLVSDMESVASYSVNYATLKNSITIDVQEQIADLNSQVGENKSAAEQALESLRVVLINNIDVTRDNLEGQDEALQQEIVDKVAELTTYINDKIEEITGLVPDDLDSLSELAEATTNNAAAMAAEVSRAQAAEAALQEKVAWLVEKLQSVDERIESFMGARAPLLELESSTPPESAEPGTPGFIDDTPGGDVSTFVVSVDGEREVYALDGIPQPTVQVPRGDVVDFDLSGLGETARQYFRIYKNGTELTDGVSYNADNVVVNTANVPLELTKIFYKNSQVQGMGWVIEITDI